MQASKAFKGKPKIGLKTSTLDKASESPIVSLSQIKPQFFRRNAIIPYKQYSSLKNADFEVGMAFILPKLRIRRFHIRKLYDQQCSKDSTHKFYHKIPKQTMKSMTHIHISGDIYKNTVEILKTARYLKGVQFTNHNHSTTDFFSRLLRHITSRLSDIYLCAGYVRIQQEGDICKLYQALGRFYHLKTLTLNASFKLKQNYSVTDYSQLEEHLAQRYFGKLPYLYDVRFSHWGWSRIFGEFLRKERSHPFWLVTSVELYLKANMLPKGYDVPQMMATRVNTRFGLESLDRYVGYRPRKNFLTIVDSMKECEDPTDKHLDTPLYEDEIVFEGYRDKLVQKVDFQAFPNLKNLSLFFEPMSMQYSFLIGGFATIKTLEKLKLYFVHRFYGAGFIFNEMLSLPSIKDFSLDIPFIGHKECDMLAQFIQKQNKLIFLNLTIQDFDTSNSLPYQRICLGLRNILKALENTPTLEHLYLKFGNVPLVKFAQESIAQGLEQASTAVKQLKSFSFHGDLALVDSSSYDHLEGFCKFLQQQKSTLTSLRFKSYNFTNASAITYLTSTLPDLQELRTFELWGCSMKQSPNSAALDLLFTQFFKTLKTLEKLEELRLQLQDWSSDLSSFETYDSINSNDQETIYWNLVEMLPDLKTLRKLHIAIPYGLTQGKLREQVLETLLGLTHVDRITLILVDGVTMLPQDYADFNRPIEVKNARKFANADDF